MKDHHTAWISLTLVIAVLFPVVAMGQAPELSVPAVGETLSEEALDVLGQLQGEDGAPPDEHYYRSNEWRQDLLRPHLEGLGGAFIGVGSDQNYTMAAMAQAKLLFVVDYDPRIPWIHEIYRVLVAASDTPAELVAHFSDEQRTATKELLEAGLQAHPRTARLVRHWSRRRGPWGAYLRRVARLERDGEPFSWLADPSLFAYVKTMFAEKRIVALRGDLTQNGALRSVGRACGALHVPVSVIYFSNAEQFFTYTEEFIENMRQLPVAENAIALRTLRHRSIPLADRGRWHYLAHRYSDFLARLETGRYRRSFAFTAALLGAGRPFLGADGISTLNEDAGERED